ncbi:excalibur calcium-binding domain-containing protein [Bacillus sp. DX4.1]|uniref:excalibur calcium-binding domain-containing protein n=1 Tax=Bacillus sp. DX4.1 TaxID=3055867 RepID=UPI0025A11621|nr:excalibur calcium-binding domain-containing protein [Bacillus sp. DX4.1]MDM5188554.1 excalibur calcium-binding domain-containing protein [Bacillus sp. DX4.1]
MSKKKKKPSESALAKQAIAKKYQKEYGSTPIIVSTNIEKMQTGYAAVAPDHIQLFKYNKDVNDVVSIAKYYFSDYSTVLVDYFAIKSVFEFEGLGTPFRFIPTEQGKDIERFIENNTSIEIHKVHRKWYSKILGFRSNTKWKMVVACIIYLFILTAGISGMIDNKNEKEAAPATKVVNTDAAKKDEEQQKLDEQRKQEEQKKQEEQRKQEELKRQQEEKKKQEEMQKQQEQQAQQKQSVQQQPNNDLPQGNYNFKSCKEAKAAGFSNITKDHPAYSSKLDRDGDGLACDK